ncbi:hypothetical protein PTT_13055, partial [Pyrenophora teres f. teres 0-1]
HIRRSTDIVFDRNSARLIEALTASPVTDLSDGISTLVFIAQQTVQQNASLQGDLDRVNTHLQSVQQDLEQRQEQLQQLHGRIAQLQESGVSNRRLSTNPDKFTGMENNITKRHQNYVTFEDKVTNCIEQDHHIFNTAFKCIHFIGSLLTDDAYESVRDGLRTVKNNTDPATWTWPTH